MYPPTHLLLLQRHLRSARTPTPTLKLRPLRKRRASPHIQTLEKAVLMNARACRHCKRLPERWTRLMQYSQNFGTRSCHSVPTSSRGSSVSSRSSGARRRERKYLYDRPDPSLASSTSEYECTEFSLGTPSFRPAHESISIRSVSSFASASHSRYRPTNLRNQMMRSPEETQQTAAMDLFPTY